MLRMIKFVIFISNFSVTDLTHETPKIFKSRNFKFQGLTIETITPV